MLDAYWQLVGDNDSIYLGDLGTKLKQLDSAFDPRSYGSASLKKLIINKTTQLDIHDVRDGLCYVRLANAIGTVKATPKKGKGFAFIVCQGEEFYFRKDDLMDEKHWSKIKSNQQVYFQRPQSTMVPLLAQQILRLSDLTNKSPTLLPLLLKNCLLRS